MTSTIAIIVKIIYFKTTLSYSNWVRGSMYTCTWYVSREVYLRQWYSFNYSIAALPNRSLSKLLLMIREHPLPRELPDLSILPCSKSSKNSNFVFGAVGRVSSFHATYSSFVNNSSLVLLGVWRVALTQGQCVNLKVTGL